MIHKHTSGTCWGLVKLLKIKDILYQAVILQGPQKNEEISIFHHFKFSNPVHSGLHCSVLSQSQLWEVVITVHYQKYNYKNRKILCRSFVI